jgi:hypothetical protein
MTTRNTQLDHNRDALLEDFAAEITLAAYRVALQTGTRGTWLDLQLDLWRTLADRVKTWGRELPLPLAGDAWIRDRGVMPDLDQTLS